jgi:hypothetical protein
VSLVVLWMLATLDAAFVGFREAAGRSGIVRKRSYYRRAMARAALVGQGALAFTGLVALVFLLGSADPSTVAASYEQAANRMLYALVPYASVVLGSLAIRKIPVVDVQALMNVTILGPFTALRPLVLVAGVVLALSAAPRIEVAILSALGIACAFGLGPFLTWRRRGVLVVD